MSSSTKQSAAEKIQGTGEGPRRSSSGRLSAVRRLARPSQNIRPKVEMGEVRFEDLAQGEGAAGSGKAAADRAQALKDQKKKLAKIRETSKEGAGRDEYYEDVDIMKTYLKEVGNIKLFTPGDEVKAAERIEKITEKLYDIVLAIPFTTHYIVHRSNLVRDGKSKIWDMIKYDELIDRGADEDAVKAKTIRTVTRLKALFTQRAKVEAELHKRVSKARGEKLAQAVRKNIGEVVQLLKGLNLGINFVEEIVRILKDYAEGRRRAPDGTLLAPPDDIPTSLPVGLKAEDLPEFVRGMEHVQREIRWAKEDFVNANLRLVISIAKKYRNSKVSLTDLVQEGNIGLMRAVDKYEYKRGLKFSTYATWWIKQAINRAIFDQSRTVRIPVYMRENLNKLKQAVKKLSNATGEMPSIHDIAKELDMPNDRVTELMQIDLETVSLDMAVGKEDDKVLADLIEDDKVALPDQEMVNISLSEELDKALKTLTPREEKILRMRFGIGGTRRHTLLEIGKDFGLTRERIRQIEKKGVEKLRMPLKNVSLEDFLDG
ncbi:MAG: sigma-70 family RNA polymerase sigma factor [Bdellovibrionota bacterium]